MGNYGKYNNGVFFFSMIIIKLKKIIKLIDEKKKIPKQRAIYIFLMYRTKYLKNTLF